MLDINLWIARLRTQLDNTVVKTIGGAANIAAVQSDLKAAPGIFILPGAQTPGPNELANGVSQLVVVSIGVLFAVRNVADAKGAAGHNALSPLVVSVKDLFLGWQPVDALRPVEYAGGELVDYSELVLWWQEIYTTEIFYRHIGNNV